MIRHRLPVLVVVFTLAAVSCGSSSDEDGTEATGASESSEVEGSAGDEVDAVDGGGDGIDEAEADNASAEDTVVLDGAALSPELTIPIPGGPPFQVVMSPAGDRIAVRTLDGIAVFDAASGEAIADTDGPDGELYWHDDQLIVVGLSAISFLDPNTLANARDFVPMAPDCFSSLSATFDRSAGLLWSSENVNGDTRICRIDLSTGDAVVNFLDDFGNFSIEVELGGDELYALVPDGDNDAKALTITQASIASGAIDVVAEEPARFLTAAANANSRIAPPPAGFGFVLSSSGATMPQFETAASSYSGNHYAVGAAGQVHFIDAQTGLAFGTIGFRATRNEGRLDWGAADDSRLAAVNENGDVEIYTLPIP